MAAHAGACQACVCTARFWILTPSHGMSPVSLSTMVAPKPPQEAPNPPGADSRPLSPPTLTVSALSAALQPGGRQQVVALQAGGRASYNPARGAKSCLDPPRPCPVSLLLLPAEGSSGCHPLGPGVSMVGGEPQPWWGCPWQGDGGGSGVGVVGWELKGPPSGAARAGTGSFFNGSREHPIPPRPQRAAPCRDDGQLGWYWWCVGSHEGCRCVLGHPGSCRHGDGLSGLSGSPPLGNGR